MTNTLTEIKIPSNGERTFPDVFISNGFSLAYNEDMELRERILNYGISASMFATCNLFSIDDRVYIFNGWESDQYERMKIDAKFITAIDITNLCIVP